MEKDYAVSLASKLLKFSSEEAATYAYEVEEHDIIYFSVPVKGGASLFVAPDGSVLFANSCVPYDLHLEEFLKGRRTPLGSFTP